jgi:hypothetical protein
LVVVYRHYHIECRGFGGTIILNHIHGSGRYADTFEKPAQLRDLLRRQFLSMRLTKDMSVLADREQHSAVRLLPCRTQPIDEMRSVRPGQVVGGRMPENRLQSAPIPI